MEMYRYSVGSKVMNPCPDSVRFELSESGATLLLAMRSPTAAEKRDFKNGVPQFKLAVANDIIFFLCRFGTGPWMDAPYYRHLSRPYSLSEPAAGEGFALHAMLVDAATGVLVAQKLIGLPHDLSVKLLHAVNAQPEIPNYDTRLAMTYQLYTTQQLLEKAEE